MFNLRVVHKAVMKSRIQQIPAADQDSLISTLIHDVFGGEILKTKSRRGWHFYNRVDGLRLDFTKPEFRKVVNGKPSRDIPVSSDETSTYFEQEQYLTFLMRFVRTFEELVGLKRYQVKSAE